MPTPEQEKRIPFWSYDNNSEGATLLQNKLRELGIISEFMPHTRTTLPNLGNKKCIINWGFQRPFPATILDLHIVNKPENILNASNKKKCFDILKRNNISIPEYTINKEQAKQMLTMDGRSKVYCRTTAHGAYGDGIIIANTPREVVNAELYVRSVKCKREYRVYIFNNKMIDLVAAVRCESLPQGVTAYNDDIRNWKNGWGWARNAVTIPQNIKTKLEEISKKAITALGLDFGAIDIVRDYEDNLYILEVNTAPGIEGVTVNKFAEAIKEYYSNLPEITENVAIHNTDIRPPLTHALRRAERETRRPEGLTEEEWGIILTRRAEEARRNRETILNNLYQNGIHQIMLDMGTTLDNFVRNNNITQEEWINIYNRIRG